MPAAAAESKTSYILDKLHSLSGVIPIGAYLADHLWSNSYALVSENKYNAISGELQTVPWRVAVEALVIWIPILFHGLYGIYIWWTGKSNAWRHPWLSNWMYTLQRWSGIVAFAFIGWHVWTERFLGHGVTRYSDVAEAMSKPWYVTFYIIGVTAASFHLGNGLWSFACKWGIAVSKRSQRTAAYFGAAVAVVLTLAGIAIVLGLRYSWFPLGSYVQ
jgi:succinate dehydrogenase / fumarate reductase, cytochrome b subunit